MPHANESINLSPEHTHMPRDLLRVNIFICHIAKKWVCRGRSHYEKAAGDYDSFGEHQNPNQSGFHFQETLFLLSGGAKAREIDIIRVLKREPNYRECLGPPL
jgi:hypothetical protein